MKRLSLAFGIILSLALPQVVLSEEVTETPWYSDVESNHVNYQAIFNFKRNGYINGFEDGTFQADAKITRVESLKIILEANQIPSSGPDRSGDFPDLEKDQWYMEYVNTALELGIMEGADDGNFYPEDEVNLAETLKMSLLAAGINDFEDVIDLDVAWYHNYYEYGIENALMAPNDGLDFVPEMSMTRGEVVELLYRMQNNNFTGEVEVGVASYYGWSFDGANTASGTALEAAGHMAAHKTLPFGTRVRITNTDNNLSTDVTIVDRGPFVEGRIIDLTPGSFEEIGTLSAGLLRVRLEVLN
jgi:hypothetical protein